MPITKDKYYTPGVEELYVGFRLEGRYRIIQESDAGYYAGEWVEWEPFIYPECCGNIFTEYRVKYLDREDIESLGWGDYKKSICDWYYIKGFFTLKNELKYMAFRLLHCHDRNTIKITGFEYEHQVAEETEYEDLFNGECKNYNELKYIMEKLGIII